MDGEKGLLIKNGSHLSINDLVKLKNEGAFVIRTGHLGNHYLSNLLLFSCGIPCHLFDRNLSIRDKNFWPGSIITGEKRIDLASRDNVLVPFSRFSDNLNGTRQFIGSAKNPAQVHLQSLKKIYGENVWTESQFLHRRAALVGKMTEFLAVIEPDLFIREISRDGFTSLIEPGRKINNITEEFLKANELMCLAVEGGLDELPRGIIPKIEATILINSILGVIESGRNDVYELSGPDMVKYAMRKSFQRKLRRLYSDLRKFMPELPERMVLHMVPTFFFRFGSLDTEKNELDMLLGYLKEFKNVNGEKRLKLKKMKSTIRTKQERFEVQLEMSKIGFSYSKALSSLAKGIYSSRMIGKIFFSLESGNFFSQYDLLKSGRRLYIPEEMKEMSMSEVEIFFKLMMNARQYASE